jgi:hypothetical protein
MLEDGRLHLSGIALLAPRLSEENCDRVLPRAANRTKRQIEELVAELAPKPDAPPTIRKLPTPPPSQLRPDEVRVSPAPITMPALKPAAPPLPRPQPLSPERYKVTFTANQELKSKLERLQALTGEDLSAVIEAAVTEKLERLEAKRYGATMKPRRGLTKTNTSAKLRYMPASVRRIVWKRDGQQCTFLDRHGRRCTERRGLEFHHDDPYGLGGDHDPARIRLLCRSHNLYLAERDYGKPLMDKYRHKSDRALETAPAYGALDRLRGQLLDARSRLI